MQRCSCWTTGASFFRGPTTVQCVWCGLPMRPWTHNSTVCVVWITLATADPQQYSMCGVDYPCCRGPTTVQCVWCGLPMLPWIHNSTVCVVWITHAAVDPQQYSMFGVDYPRGRGWQQVTTPTQNTPAVMPMPNNYLS